MTIAAEQVAKLRDLREAAKEMRELQKRYFKGERNLLEQCRHAEQRLDRTIRETEELDQPTLF